MYSINEVNNEEFEDVNNLCDNLESILNNIKINMGEMEQASVMNPNILMTMKYALKADIEFISKEEKELSAKKCDDNVCTLINRYYVIKEDMQRTLNELVFLMS